MKKIIFVCFATLLIFSCSRSTDFKGVAYVTFGGGDVKPIAGNEIYLIDLKTKNSIDSLKKDLVMQLSVVSIDSFQNRLDSLGSIVNIFYDLKTQSSINYSNALIEFNKSLFDIEKGKIIIASPKSYLEFHISLDIYLSNKASHVTEQYNDLYEFGKGTWTLKNKSGKRLSYLDLDFYYGNKLIGSYMILDDMKENEKVNLDSRKSSSNSILIDKDFTKKDLEFLLSRFQKEGLKNLKVIPNVKNGSKFNKITKKYESVNFEEFFKKELDLIHKKAFKKLNDFKMEHANINSIVEEYNQMLEEKGTFLIDMQNKIALEYDLKMLNIIKKNNFKSTRTNLKGEFEFKNIPRDDYYIYKHFKTNFTSIYWYLPIDLNTDKPFELTNFNSNKGLYSDFEKLSIYL